MISRAKVQGAGLSSTRLLFTPASPSGGDYHFDVSETKGSAGSTSLVLQTIFLPLCFAGDQSAVSVIGGTHVPWSPPFHYINQVFLPMLNRLGGNIGIDIEQWGWYPLGGGQIAARIQPQRVFSSLNLTDRGRLLWLKGISVISNLPMDIAKRQRAQALKTLMSKGFEADIELFSAPSPGKGTFLFLLAGFENITAGFGALGAIGKRAEEVADEACRELLDHLNTDGAFDPHLADQIAPYLSLAGGPSRFSTSRITKHLLTNLWVIRYFLDVEISVSGAEGERGTVLLSGTEQRRG
jgi:RNA 3'-terminal phosphate cyclase (ATP)